MQRPLKVGFVCILNANDADILSGVPYNIYNGLLRHGISVELLSPLKSGSKYLLAPLKFISKISKKKVILDHSMLMSRSFSRQISNFIKQKKVDIIFSAGSTSIADLECDIPIVFWTDAVFHQMCNYYNHNFQDLSAGAIRRGKRQEEKALNNCTSAVYASNWAAGGARTLTQPDKIHVIPRGANMQIQHSAEDVQAWIDKKCETSDRVCKLLFIGADWKRKNGDVVVETARILNEWNIPTELTVVGCNPPGPFPSYVKVLGFISKKTPEGMKRIDALMRDSDFFIMPSQAEAAGIVFCEASAFALPSLSYATGGIPEYVLNNVNGVCLQPGTPPTEFAKAIRDIFRDKARYRALANGAYREYATRLNWDTSIQRLIEVLTQAVETHQQAHRDKA